MNAKVASSNPTPSRRCTDDPSAESAPSPPELVQRKYLELIEPRTAGQFSVRLGYGGTHSYFPLGEQNERRAASRAATLQQLLQREGWVALCRRFPREFTLALFWNQNPLLCTYTTLLTLTAKAG